MVFIVLYVILRFARSSAYHHAHMVDTYDYLSYGYFGCQCSIVEKNGWLRFRFPNKNKTYSSNM